MFTTLGKVRGDALIQGWWMEIAGLKCRIIRIIDNDDLTVTLTLAYYDDTMKYSIEMKIYKIQEFEVFESE